MPYLPLKCITNVIEWIDNPHDLFNLLTVSKDVFLLASRRLYRNPMKTLASTVRHKDKILKLLHLLLSLSPSTREDIEIIRKSIGLPPPGAPLSPQPMLNYLSLVKVIHWPDPIYMNCRLSEALGYPKKDIYLQLTWAFVGHRLDEVEELEIEVFDHEQYLDNAAKMTRLRKIWIRHSEFSKFRSIEDCGEAMIRSIQLHHGPYQLRECHLIPNPFYHSPTIINTTTGLREADLSGTWRVLSLLPPPRHCSMLPRPDGSMVSLDHPFDPYAALIRTLNIGDHGYMTRVMTKAYSGYSGSQTLQRFRGMTSLTIHSGAANGNDENLLDWAVCEVEHYNHKLEIHQFAPLVRVNELKVEYKDKRRRMTSGTRSSTPKWKILQDGLLGFSNTLESLTVVYPQSADGMGDPLFTVPRPLHKLSHLYLWGLAIDRSVGEQAPNIQWLQISFDFLPLRASAIAPNGSQDDHNTGTTPPPPTSAHTTTATATTDQKPQRHFPEFWFHFPKLTKLTLQDRAVNLFDPNCLHLSPNIERLELFSGVDSYGIGEVPRILHPTRWTWDWSLPALRHLVLSGDLHEIRFSFGILRSCPTLRSIVLNHEDRSHRFPLCVKEIFDDSLDKKNNQVLPFTHSNLLSIEFNGDWVIKADELARLLQMLLCLMEIQFGTSKFDEGFGDRELVEITKIHPALRYVISALELTDRTKSSFALNHVNSEQLEEIVSLVGDIEGYLAQETPKERLMTVYGFNNCVATIHQL